MPSPAKLLASASGASVDPNFRNVTLLLHGDGSNGAQNNTFIDGSTNNFTITRNGNTTQGSFSPYGSRWSNYFDGTGDYLGSSGGAGTAVGTGDFSVEAFVYWTSYPTQYTTIFSTRATNGASTTAFTVGVESSGFVYAYSNAYIAQTASSVFLLNTWNHVVFTRSGTTARLFVNGVLRATGTNSQNFSDQPFAIGANRDGTEQSAGYVSDVRLVKGSIPTAYQTSSTTVGTTVFTPPTAPLTAISGTSLLTCQSNRILDASTNNFAITVNGDTRVSPFSPYAPTTSYSAATNGGSMYFDGNGDYLTTPSSTAFNLGGGDCTAECWVNFSSTANVPHIFEIGDSAVNRGVVYQTGGYIRLWNVSDRIVSNILISPNVWYHVAVSRVSGTYTLYVNGISQGTYASTIFPNVTSELHVGFQAFTGTSADYFNGYISNLRVVKGTAVYTAAFTPPTAPVTAITNTSLLVNGTNAGIVDSSADNDLETVGNAQISTSVKKFGTGSIAFDGSGDYLVAPSSTAFDLGSGDFTIECWFNANSFAAPFGLISRYAVTAGVSAYGWLIQVRSSTSIRLLRGNDLYFDSTVSTMSTGTWYHVAAVRNGSTFTLYLNGTQAGQATGVSNFTDASSTTLQIGRTHTVTDDMNGYIDDIRITKGVARYTANFTPPTAAFPDQ